MLSTPQKRVEEWTSGAQDADLRILVCTEQFLPTRGGSITWLLNTYSRFKPQEVVIVAGAQPEDGALDQELPFRVERLPMTMADWDPTVPASMAHYLRLVWQVSRRCSWYGLRQVHCAKVLPEGLISYAMYRLFGIPYLLYAHGEEILTAMTSRKLAWLLPRIYRGAAAIIANARNTQQLLLDLGIAAHKIHLIHPGVDGQTLRVGPEARERIRQRHHLGTSPVLLTVGRMQRRKGQDMVIRALPQIKLVVPQVQYVMVGAGEELTSLQELARSLGVQDNVRFVGKVADDELAAYYAACDVFIMPNRQIDADIEGFGIVYLEAGAAGKPVIGGHSGGTADAIVDGVTGVRVDGNSVHDIATAAIALLTHPTRAASMGRNGQQRVGREFTWEAVVRRTRQLAVAIEPSVGQGVWKS
jgi:phosphatidylinositol alpha-1,6-mannosyltransferase